MSASTTRLTSFAASAAVAAGLAVPFGLVSASSADAAATAARPARACVSAGCTIVSRADVDGDGRQDTTSLTRMAKGQTYSLRVVTARGAVATTRFATPWLIGNKPFNGAARLDGVRGAELVVMVGTGAHTQYSRVYTWRAGRLVAEKDPSGSVEWITDGALSSAMGYSLRVSNGTRHLTQISLGRDSWDKNATFSGRRIVSVWKNGRWTPTSDRTVTVPDSPAVWNGSGWNVKGLQRY